MRWFVEKKVTAGFGVTLVLLIIIGGLSYQNTTGLLAGMKWEIRAYEVLSKLHSLLLLVTDAETGQRGYIITGREEYLGPYNAAIGEIDQTITDLRRITAGSANQQRRLDVLDSLISDKLALLRERIALRKQGEFEAAVQSIKTGRGRHLMAAIRMTVQEMENEEQALLKQYSTDVKGHAREMMPIITLSSVFAFLLVVVSSIVINRQMAERKRAEEALVDQSRILETFFKGIINPLALLDRDFNFIQVNEAYARADQRDISEFPGHNHFEFYPSDAKAIFERVVETKIPFQTTARPFVYPSHPEWGVTYWDWTLVPILDNTGEAECLVLSLKDVTEQIRAENTLQQKHEQLRALTVRLAEVEEIERQRLVRELHDQVGTNLTALGISLNIIRAQLPEEAASIVHPRLDDALSLVEQTAELIRDVMADLRPPVLDGYGLVAALQWCGAKFASRTGIAVNVHGEELIPRLAGSVENALFRIAQEALINVAKHAQATHVTMTVEGDGENIRLVIADNGIGFDPASLVMSRERQGWGLMTMRERVEAIGGRCHIESRPGHGTRVIGEVVR